MPRPAASVPPGLGRDAVGPRRATRTHACAPRDALPALSRTPRGAGGPPLGGGRSADGQVWRRSWWRSFAACTTSGPEPALVGALEVHDQAERDGRQALDAGQRGGDRDVAERHLLARGGVAEGAGAGDVGAELGLGRDRVRRLAFERRAEVLLAASSRRGSRAAPCRRPSTCSGPASAHAAEGRDRLAPGEAPDVQRARRLGGRRRRAPRGARSRRSPRRAAPCAAAPSRAGAATAARARRAPTAAGRWRSVWPGPRVSRPCADERREQAVQGRVASPVRAAERRRGDGRLVVGEAPEHAQRALEHALAVGHGSSPARRYSAAAAGEGAGARRPIRGQHSRLSALPRARPRTWHRSLSELQS